MVDSLGRCMAPQPFPFLSPFSDEKGAKNPGCEANFDSGSVNPND